MSKSQSFTLSFFDAFIHLFIQQMDSDSYCVPVTPRGSGKDSGEEKGCRWAPPGVCHGRVRAQAGARQGAKSRGQLLRVTVAAEATGICD